MIYRHLIMLILLAANTII